MLSSPEMTSELSAEPSDGSPQVSWGARCSGMGRAGEGSCFGVKALRQDLGTRVAVGSERIRLKLSGSRACRVRSSDRKDGIGCAWEMGAGGESGCEVMAALRTGLGAVCRVNCWGWRGWVNGGCILETA